MQAGLILRHAQGWPETDPAHDGERTAKAAEEARARALAMGAPR